MAQYPVDPYAADRALAEWARARGHALNATPDQQWYRAWYPCLYLPAFARLGREIRATFGEANVALVELFDADPLKQATGEDRLLTAFLASPRLTRRVAVRSKSGGGIVNELGSGLGSLFGGSPGGILGDPTFESRYDIKAPSREEGNLALPFPLRQMLVQTQWRGILEVRAGGLVCASFDRRQLDPASLDATFSSLGQIYQLAAG